ncbi:hypothetical protein, partial [Enterobacter cloacae complex sp. 4DZ3-17B2]|uniref:hypothetical protein n=1 Tax=Enterobacter cloacae complex sp. 4DZ3-17B2 TaxID=2511990 RepID=UPI001CA54C10
SDKYILSYVKGYRLPFSEIPFQKAPPKCRNFSSIELMEFQYEIEYRTIEMGCLRTNLRFG